MMRAFEEEMYLMTGNLGFDKTEEAEAIGLLPGHSYSVIGCWEAEGGVFSQFEEPLEETKVGGDWSESSDTWTAPLKLSLKPVFDPETSNFWMSFPDFTYYFSSLTVCKVKNWDELRVRGTFTNKRTPAPLHSEFTHWDSTSEQRFS